MVFFKIGLKSPLAGTAIFISPRPYHTYSMAPGLIHIFLPLSCPQRAELFHHHDLSINGSRKHRGSIPYGMSQFCPWSLRHLYRGHHVDSCSLCSSLGLPAKSRATQVKRQLNIQAAADRPHARSSRQQGAGGHCQVLPIPNGVPHTL